MFLRVERVIFCGVVLLLGLLAVVGLALLVGEAEVPVSRSDWVLLGKSAAVVLTVAGVLVVTRRREYFARAKRWLVGA